MKPFVVVACGNKIHEDWFAHKRRDVRNYFSAIDESVPKAYYYDDEASAEAHANYLAEKHPGYSFIVAKSSSVSFCPAAPVKRNVFTEQGLLPE